MASRLAQPQQLVVDVHVLTRETRIWWKATCVEVVVTRNYNDKTKASIPSYVQVPPKERRTE